MVHTLQTGLRMWPMLHLCFPQKYVTELDLCSMTSADLWLALDSCC